MRRFLMLVAGIVLAAAPLAALSQTTAAGVAPADEYFGRYSESVLEIRNRIDLWDAKSHEGAAATGAIRGLDTLANAVTAWQRRYPADPWVVDAMAKLLKCYARAGFASSPRVDSMLGILLATYPNTEQTKEALAAVGSALVSVPSDPAAAAANGDPGATVSGRVVDAGTGAPIPDALVVVTPTRDATDVGGDAFAATAADGSFSIKDVPAGMPYSANGVSLARAEYIVVEPPPGSDYAAYQGVVDATSSSVAAGDIALAAR